MRIFTLSVFPAPLSPLTSTLWSPPRRIAWNARADAPKTWGASSARSSRVSAAPYAARSSSV